MNVEAFCKNTLPRDQDTGEEGEETANLGLATGGPTRAPPTEYLNTTPQNLHTLMLNKIFTVYVPIESSRCLLWIAIRQIQ